MQKVAITVWKQRLSPVFESCGQLLVITCQKERKVTQNQYFFKAQDPMSRVVILTNLKVDVLICGAISSTFYNLLSASEIEIISFVHGNWDEILKTYMHKQAALQTYKMPGCAYKHRKRFRGGW